MSFPLKIALRNFGITHFLISPDGQPYPVFLNLPVDLRRRLRLSLPDTAIVQAALQQHWVIITVLRRSAQARRIRQSYQVRVVAERHTFGGKIRSFAATRNVLHQLEQALAQRLPVRVELLEFTVGHGSVIHSEFASSAAFAQIFLHTISGFNRPIERNLLPTPPNPGKTAGLPSGKVVLDHVNPSQDFSP